MVAAVSSIYASDNHGQALLNEVVQLFADLLAASGATPPMIELAMKNATHNVTDNNAATNFTDLGSLLRDCMEVMCAWRRNVDMVDANGDATPLSLDSGTSNFEILCQKAHCQRPVTEILQALLEFGAVSIEPTGLIRSETPTFLIGKAIAGGRLATDGLLKHLEGFLKCVHRNVKSVSTNSAPRFERVCSVTVALELEPVFERLVRQRGQEFIDSIDEWLERHVKVQSPSGRYIELGAGAYCADFGAARS